MGIFNTVPVQKPKHSAFDLSYNNFFTCNMGELIPSLVLPIMPGDKIMYSPTFQVRFAPMVNPVFGDIYAKQECFFVPYRLLWTGWKSFITQNSQRNFPTDAPSVVPSSSPFIIPFSGGSSSNPVITDADLAGARLADFFGATGFYRYLLEYKSNSDSSTWPSGADNFKFNCFPFYAYNLIWNEYYRDEFVDSELVSSFVSSTSRSLSNFKVLRRRWAKDYFTTATPYPQFGSQQGASVTVTGTASLSSGSVIGSFTVAQMRFASVLQKFTERTNIGGGRYNEFILAHFGCMPTDATIDRPEFLGSVTAPVQVNAVANTAGAGSTSQASISDAQGSLAGTASAVGTKFCFSRSFKEYGIILGLFSVAPRPIYSDGINRYLHASIPSDFCLPEFATVGDQAVDKSELSASAYISYGQTFGYQQRYAEYKFHNDEAHGDFVLDDKLPTYTFARFFSSTVALNSEFLECTPRTNCFVTLIQRGQADNPNADTCWVQLRNNIKAIRPLPRYSTPTL